MICFNPNPETTQGEAEFAGRLARQLPLAFDRAGHDHAAGLPGPGSGCSAASAGQVYVMTAPIPWHMWPYELAYEWAATVKALVFNRSC